MPCAMSSLRGASGVVWGDRVVCSLVLHATTIAHLDVRLCTDLFFLLCVPCVRGVPAPVRCCLCVLALVLWLCLPAPCSCACCGGCVRGCVLCHLCLCLCVICAPVVPIIIPALIPPVYMGLLYNGCYAPPYACLLFRIAFSVSLFCVYNKSRHSESEYGFQKVGLNLRCYVFSILGIFQVKFPA